MTHFHETSADSNMTTIMITDSLVNVDCFYMKNQEQMSITFILNRCEVIFFL